MVRIARFYVHYAENERQQLQSEVIKVCLSRSLDQSTIVDFQDYTLVYRKFGYIMFIAGISNDENELAMLELFQHILEILNTHFGGVSEQILTLNIDKVHMILDEIIINGQLSETCQPRVLAPLQLMTTVKR